MSAINEIVAVLKHKNDWMTANDIMRAGTFTETSANVMAALQYYAQPGRILERYRPHGIYVYRIREGANTSDVENNIVRRPAQQTNRREYRPDDIVLKEVRDALDTHKTVAGIMGATRYSDMVVRAALKALTAQGCAKCVGVDTYEKIGSKPETWRQAIDNVSQAHAAVLGKAKQQDVSTPTVRTVSRLDKDPETWTCPECKGPMVPYSKKCRACYEKPKESVPQQDASTRKAEDTGAPVSTHPAAPTEQSHIEKTLAWLRQNREDLERRRAQVDQAIAALERLMGEAAA